jgi:hypothetical protein
LRDGRRAHREDLLGQQQADVQAGVDPPAVADADVDRVAREVDGARLRAHGEVDPGVGRGEPRQARAEPAVGEGRQDRDRERAGRRAAAHLLDRAGEAGEGLAQLGQGAPAGLGQRQPARQAAEQGDAQVGLEQADLLADRGGASRRARRRPWRSRRGGRRPRRRGARSGEAGGAAWPRA